MNSRNPGISYDKKIIVMFPMAKILILMFKDLESFFIMYYNYYLGIL